MKIYILPEKREEFAKKIERATRHLESKPKVTYSEPMLKERRIHFTEWGDDGRKYLTKPTIEKVSVIEVEMENITSGDWVMVANVLYREGLVAMIDATRFKNIPKHLGLDYAKCDYCGHSHTRRIKAHIVYNTKTGEWKQIGTSCGKAMFRGGDIATFVVKLAEIIDLCGGCTEEDWEGWCGRIPDHSWQVAHNIYTLIPAVVGYRKEVSREWQKASGYKGTYTWIVDEEGTTKKLERYIGEHPNLVADEELNNRIKTFVESLPYDMNSDGIYEEGFNTKIKRAFENEYILLNDIYTVFFALKMYEESLTKGDWENAVKSLIIGQKTQFRDMVLVSKDLVEGYYGSEWWAKFQDAQGIIYTKSFSNWSSFEAQFKGAGDRYSFAARVDYINNNKRTVRLGGRVSKIS